MTNKPQIYYHGSNTKLTDCLSPRRTFNNAESCVVSGVFITPDINRAKYFALIKCIGGLGHVQSCQNKIFIENLKQHIQTEFYIYTIQETPDNLVHDTEQEYYSIKPVKIIHSETFDTISEIQKLGYEIYVLDEPLHNKFDLNKGENFAIRQEMNNVINAGKYHRIDIADMIKKQQNTQQIISSIDNTRF